MRVVSLVVVGAVAVAVTVAACSGPAPLTAPVHTSTASQSAGPRTTPTSDAPLTPPAAVIPPRLHDPAAVAAYLDNYHVSGLTRQPVHPGTHAVVAACPAGPSVTRHAGPDAYSRGWAGPGGVRADVAAVTFPDLAAASRAAGPLLDAAAGCQAPKPSEGVTTTVTGQRRDVAEGMPLGRVDLTRTSEAGTFHDYIGLVQVGNVLIGFTYTALDAKMANDKGSTALALLARDVQRL